MPRTVTYSPSFPVALTPDCPWHCTYCGFRTDQQGLIADAEFHRLLDLAQAQGVSEIQFLAGEASDTLPHLRSELRRRGFPDFIAYARWACRVVVAPPRAPTDRKAPARQPGGCCGRRVAERWSPALRMDTRRGMVKLGAADSGPSTLTGTPP